MRIATTFTLLLLSIAALAQDDLLDMLDSSIPEGKEFTKATFKGTRVINGHSLETRSKGIMDFIISHRFGTINSGIYELYGLDNASVRIGLEYAPTDRLYVGVGRSSFEKTFDGFAKYRLLWQATGKGAAPLSITWFSSVSYKTLKISSESLDPVQRMSYTNQALIGRKFNDRLSLQIMPTWVHFNYIGVQENSNDVYAIGAGGRFKFTQRFGLTVEYYHQLEKRSDATFNPIAIGFDIETGGHVFQLQFTNATAMFPKGFIGETTNDFFDGDIHFGFNISRTFQLYR